MRLLVAFIDSDSWSEVLDDAASAATAGLLLSNSIRRDTKICIVLRGERYRWLCIHGGRVRNLRPDIESAKGLINAFIFKGRGRGFEVGEGIPECLGTVVKVVFCSRPEVNLQCPSNVTLVFNGANEYPAARPLCLPNPPRPLHHTIAVANILLDEACKA